MSIRLVHPCPQSTPTDAFGWRTWADGSSDFHTGQDFAAPAWTPIYAAHSGRVTALWWDAYPNGAGAGGNMIKIGAAGFSTRYAHLIAYAVKAGDEVQAGQLIGYVGATGAAVGNHLHFEQELPGGQFVDPMPYLNATPAPAPEPEPIIPEEDIMTIYIEPTDNSSPTIPGDPTSGRVWAGDGRPYDGVKYSPVWALDTDTGATRRLTQAEWAVVQGAYAATDRPIPLARPNGNAVEIMLHAPRKSPL